MKGLLSLTGDEAPHKEIDASDIDAAKKPAPLFDAGPMQSQQSQSLVMYLKETIAAYSGLIHTLLNPPLEQQPQHTEIDAGAKGSGIDAGEKLASALMNFSQTGAGKMIGEAIKKALIDV